MSALLFAGFSVNGNLSANRLSRPSEGRFVQAVQGAETGSESCSHEERMPQNGEIDFAAFFILIGKCVR